jgi:hypothetical protein
MPSSTVAAVGLAVNTPPHALVLPLLFVRVVEFLSGHRCDCSGGVGVSLQLSTALPGRLLLRQLIAVACQFSDLCYS